MPLWSKLTAMVRSRVDLKSKASWVEAGNLVVLTATLFAAGAAAFEARHMSNLTRRAISEADAAARKQQAISIDTEHRQLRAYVLLESARLIETHNGVTPTVSIKNSGQTPAYNVTSWWNVRAGPELPTLVDEGGHNVLPFQETGSDTADLGAGESYTLPGQANTAPPKPIDWDAVRSGQQTLYVWGIVKYRDIFQNCQRSVFYLRTGGPNWNQLSIIAHSASGDDGDRCKGDPPVAKSEYLPQ
jgi:hypothetical protein